jgi:hypothetical protein
LTRLDHAHIPVGDAAAGAGITSDRLQKWLDRGQVVLGPHDKPTTGSGDPRLLTLRRILHYAVTAALYERGLPVKLAASVAFRFSDQPSPSRAAGELYPAGETLLYAAGPLPDSAIVINHRPKPAACVAIVVDVGAIVSETKARLASRGVDLAA